MYVLVSGHRVQQLLWGHLPHALISVLSGTLQSGKHENDIAYFWNLTVRHGTLLCWKIKGDVFAREAELDLFT